MAVTESRRPHDEKSALLAGAISVIVALVCAPTAYAANWRLEPTLRGSAILTDNANQSENDPQEELALSATPGIAARYVGSRRVQAILQYEMTGVARFGGDESNDLLHNLNALGKAELVEDFLFIDGSAHISQELISLEGSLADAVVSGNNRTTVGTYSVSPYIQKRLGTFANAQARYTYHNSIFENDNVNDIKANELTAGLTSGTSFDDLSWGLNYSIRNAEYEDASDSTFEDVVASLGYALTRKFRVFGTVGEEWNDYLSASETDGSSWSVGFGWSPSRRTSIEASAGERFFGSTYSLSARHRTRESSWNVSYVEDLNDIDHFLYTTGTVYDYLCPAPDGGFLLYIDWPFNLPPEPGCIPFGGTPGLVFDLRNGVYISRALRAGVTWGLGRLTYSLSAFDLRRDYQQLDNAEDRTQGVSAVLSYRLAPLTHATGSLALERNSISAALSASNADREDDIYRLTLGVNHQFDPKLSGSLEYQRHQRDSNIADGSFKENRITATAWMSF